MEAMQRWRIVIIGALLAACTFPLWSQRGFRGFGGGGRRTEFDGPAVPKEGEFHFLRMEYVDQGGGGFGGFGRGGGRGGRGGGFSPGWWRQDFPEADAHFVQGVKRLTRIDVGEPRHSPLDANIFNYPWIYATQAGYMDLTAEEVKNLHDYLLRGGFLVTDDFWGLDDWESYRESMDKVLPGVEHVEIDNSHPMMNVMYTITERVTIPGLRHLYQGPGGSWRVGNNMQGPPHWRAMHDPKNRMVVASNFNQDVGDAWEHADLPEYPEAMTSLAYRFGINYIVYAMTH
jgi:hypothetical protein